MVLVVEIISAFSIIYANLQKFKVESWSKDLYGQFYNGDSYIILNVRSLTYLIIISCTFHISVCLSVIRVFVIYKMKISVGLWE